MPRRPGAASTTTSDPRLIRAGQLLQTGRPAEALPLLYEAAAHAPDNAGIRHDLGQVCLQAGRGRDAVEAFEAALAIKPRFALAKLHLGIALQSLGDDAAALSAYRSASESQPSLVEARYHAGALLETLGRRSEAIAAFRRAAATTPRTSLTRLANARALLAEGRDGEAERALRQLLALDPAALSATELLGVIASGAGRFEEAYALLDQVTRKAPQLAGSYYELVRCRRTTSDDADLIARMQLALGASGLHAEARLKLHLALGKAFDDLDDPSTAMRHYDAADDWRRSLCHFDPVLFEARIDRLIAQYTPESVLRLARSGRLEPTPIVIVGLPRTGTTLVEHILSSHPEVRAGGELPFWTEHAATSDPAATAGDYLRLLHRLAAGATRVTDKSPFNILQAGLIHTALPEARIVLCRRSAIDTALSIHRTYFNQHLAFPTGGEALVAAIRAVERLAEHWRQVLPSDRLHEVVYEDLVTTPEPVIRRLVAACELEWSDACLRPEMNPRVVNTPSRWQVRQPISADKAGSWRRYEPWLGCLGTLATPLPSETYKAELQNRNK